MKVRALIDFISILEQLKCNTRHSWTSSGRQESVAEHSFMLAVMAWLVKDEFPEADMHKVMLMCLVHDFGEAVTGDIPSFEKTEADEQKEEEALERLLQKLPDHLYQELQDLYEELQAAETVEARLCWGLDKMEVVLQHNLADLESWIPLEYDLQLEYGKEQVSGIPYLQELKEILNEDSRKKIKAAASAEHRGDAGKE